MDTDWEKEADDIGLPAGARIHMTIEGGLVPDGWRVEGWGRSVKYDDLNGAPQWVFGDIDKDGKPIEGGSVACLQLWLQQLVRSDSKVRGEMRWRPEHSVTLNLTNVGGASTAEVNAAWDALHKWAEVTHVKVGRPRGTRAFCSREELIEKAVRACQGRSVTQEELADRIGCSVSSLKRWYKSYGISTYEDLMQVMLSG